MARNKGTFQFAANFEVKAAAALDPRVAVATKAELIIKETWPYDGDTIYLYKGILVSVQDENAIYMLIDTDNILSSDYSGWLRVDAGNAEQLEVINSLDSDATDKALSAKQGKVLMGEIQGVKAKLVNIYTYKGSKQTYEQLPTDAEVGDVWNVVEAYDEHPAGTNYAYVGGGYWDALGGPIDLSNYLSKSEVETAIKVETDRAIAEEARLVGLIEANAKAASEAQALASDNQNAIASVSTSVGNINLILNGNDDDTDDIPNQIGIVGRLEAVETLIGTPTTEDKTSTMLSRLTALEELVTGGGEEGGETDQTLLQKINQNTLDIKALETTVYGSDGNSGLVKNIEVLTGTSTVEGSIDYKIAQAFAWQEVT